MLPLQCVSQLIDNCQLSTVNCQLSITHSPFAIPHLGEKRDRVFEEEQ